jgi:hypothetical protein
MSSDSTAHLARSYDLATKVSRVFQTRAKLAQERFTGSVQQSFAEHVAPLLGRPMTPWDFWAGWSRYAVDFTQRSALFWDTLRQRGNTFVEHTRAGLPHLLGQVLPIVRQRGHRAAALPRVRALVGRLLPHEARGDRVDHPESLRGQ